jgi:hypothetical protein
MNNVTSYATGYGGNVADVLVDGYWQTSALLGGSEWFNDYCVQYDEVTGNGWGDGIESPIRYIGSNPDKSNKVIALQPTYNEKGQLCVLNLAKNLGDHSSKFSPLQIYLSTWPIASLNQLILIVETPPLW